MPVPDIYALLFVKSTTTITIAIFEPAQRTTRGKLLNGNRNIHVCYSIQTTFAIDHALYSAHI